MKKFFYNCIDLYDMSEMSRKLYSLYITIARILKFDGYCLRKKSYSVLRKCAWTEIFIILVATNFDWKFFIVEML